MMILVCYDVSARRLRRVARACLDHGQRVQFSVFEVEVDPAQWTAFKDRLCREIAPETDSLRFYYLGKSWQAKVEHFGAKAVLDLNGPLVF